jgi:hypothetical protein
VTVLGYNSEPYLRVGPKGVFQNLNSPATYLNRTRAGATPIPPGLPTDPSAAPRWQKVSSGPVARWHHHRTHRMGASPLPDVRRTPDQVHVQPPRRVNLRQGDTPIVITGELTWVPGPSPWPWLAAAATLAVGCVLLGRLRRYGWPLAVSSGHASGCRYRPLGRDCRGGLRRC